MVGATGLRKHGFEAPRHPLQLSSWALFVVLVSGFYACQAPFLPTAWAIVTAVAFGIAAACVAYATYKCTSIDPQDPVLHNQSDPALASTEGRVYCNLCRDDVQKRSKHCRICNKCIEVFDHHCKWLNTCVGKRNYRYFLGILSSTFALTMVQLVCCAYLILDYFLSPSYRGWQRGVDYLGCSGTSEKCSSFIALQIAFAVLLVPVVGLIAQLGWFHITLLQRQQTTYDYIVEQVKKEREREQQGRGDDGLFGVMVRCLECSATPQCVKGSTKPRGPRRGKRASAAPTRGKRWGKSGKTAPKNDAPAFAKSKPKMVTPESSPNASDAAAAEEESALAFPAPDAPAATGGSNAESPREGSGESGDEGEDGSGVSSGEAIV